MSKRTTLTIMAVFIVGLVARSALGEHGGGSGAPEDPCQIWDANQMQAIGADPCDWDNGFGLFYMAGNVWEWCNDWYDADYYSTSPHDNPQGPVSGAYRVLRGGSWEFYAGRCRVADRRNGYPDYRSRNDGFRVVLDIN